MKTPIFPDGVAQNIASSAASLLDDATAFSDNPTPRNAADLMASMRIMQHRLAKALQVVEEELSPEAAPLHTINDIKFFGGGSARLLLNFDDDDRKMLTHQVDLSPLLAQSGVFEPLREPAIFNDGQIGPHGRSLVWKVGKGADDVVDLSADELWLMAHPEERVLGGTGR